MKALLFTIQTFVLAVGLVLLLNFEFKDQTLESHILNWVRTSNTALRVQSALDKNLNQLEQKIEGELSKENLHEIENRLRKILERVERQKSSSED